MDRGQLSIWSLGLTDEEFPQAFAALGAFAALQTRLLRRLVPNNDVDWAIAPDILCEALNKNDGLLRWRVPSLAGHDAVLFRTPVGVVPFPRAEDALAMWEQFRSLLTDQSSRLSLRIAVQNRGAPIAQIVSAITLLSEPAIGADSVFLDAAFPSDGRIQWNWPFVISTLPDDPLTEHFAKFQAYRPPDWPIRFAKLERGLPNTEVLVIGASPTEALMSMLTSKIRPLSRLVIVADQEPATDERTDKLARALVTLADAEGVVLVKTGVSAAEFAEQTKQFAYDLTHNYPIDVALARVWPKATKMLNRDLLTVSRLNHALIRTSRELRKLDANVQIDLSTDSAMMLGLPLQEVESPLLTRSDLTKHRFSSFAPDVANAIESMQHSYTYQREGAEASAISELLREVEAKRLLATAQEPRYVRQQSWCKHGDDLVEERRGYQVGRTVLLNIVIGPRRDGEVTAPGPFPQDKLPFNADGHSLQVMLYEPRQFKQPMLQDIHLPIAGDSETASFTFTPRLEGAFEARVCVLHRGRVLQTLLLRTQAFPQSVELSQNVLGIVLDEETRVHHDWTNLSDRGHFDMAIVLNHSADGEPRATTLAGNRAWATDLRGIDEPVRDINNLISEVAMSVADYANGLDQGKNPELMVELARVGSDLYSMLYPEQLKKLATEGFDVGDDSIHYLQVVNARADTVVPLEFFYDFNAPTPEATLCPQYRKALEDGQCPRNCARSKAPQDHVCPMGFWGLRKVIERHVFDAKAARPPDAEFVLQVEDANERQRLNLLAGAVLAHSQKVAGQDLTPLVKTLENKMGRIVPIVNDWKEWCTQVRLQEPTMLIAFPHNDGNGRNVSLEIGGNTLFTLGLSSEYIRVQGAPPPVVFLLGCDVAGTAQTFSSHIRYFRQAGAAIVVSTIATVFGPHAVRVGQAIVEALVDNDLAADGRIGEVIRNVKRQALLDSVPMALCVVAFGDADWRLEWKKE